MANNKDDPPPKPKRWPRLKGIACSWPYCPHTATRRLIRRGEALAYFCSFHFFAERKVRKAERLIEGIHTASRANGELAAQGKAGEPAQKSSSEELAFPYGKKAAQAAGVV